MGKDSGGSQTTNTIQKSDRWGPIQPYLLEGAQAASNLYNATPGGTQPYPGQQMALLLDWMRNNILSGINSASSAARTRRPRCGTRWLRPSTHRPQATKA